MDLCIDSIFADKVQLVNVTDDMSEWDSKFASMGNVLQLYIANKNNCLPHNIHDIVSQESLASVMHDFVLYVKKFFSWLLDAVKKMFNKIRDFFKRIFTQILEFLGFKNGRKTLFWHDGVSRSSILETLADANKKCYFKYYFADLDAALSKYREKCYPKCNFKTIVSDVVHDICFNISELREKYNKVHDGLKAGTVAFDPPKQVHARVIMDDLSRIYDKIFWFPQAFTMQDAVISDIEKLIERFNNTDLTEENVIDKINDIFNKCIDNINKVFIDSVRLTIDNPDENDPSSYKRALGVMQNMLQGVRIVAASGVHVYEMIFEFIKRAYKDYNIGADAINMEIELPADFKQHIQEHFGEKSTIRKVFLTSLSPDNWGDVSHSVTGGYTHSSGTADCVWVATQQLHNSTAASVARKLYVAQNGDDWYVHPWGALLKVIVHECKHNSDVQNGRKNRFEGDNVPYRQRYQEARAFKAEKDFVPTASEIAWAKSIIAKINATV